MAEHSEVAFNLSHTDDRVLVAAGRVRHIGVDCEKLRLVANVLEVAEECLAPEELDWLRAVPANGQSEAFLRIWTRKEAVTKALGCGVSFPWRSFTVLPLSESRLRVFAGSCDLVVFDIPASTDTVSAVAHSTECIAEGIQQVSCPIDAGCSSLKTGMKP
jgi:phosphopantetheinyl transferase